MGGVSGRIGELITRLARPHERRARESFACGLERAVEEVDRPWSRAAAVPIDRPAVAEAAPLQHPPGTLAVEAQAILRICDEDVFVAEPREFVRS